jgi:hypothetical protein
MRFYTFFPHRYGVPGPKGENLATCIWQSKARAAKARNGPKHAEAVRLARHMYERYDLEHYVLRKNRGEKRLRVEPWKGGEVGW